MVKVQKVLGVLVCVAFIFVGYLLYTGQYPLPYPLSLMNSPHTPETNSTVITFNQKTPLRVTVVKDGPEMERGLSGRTSLDPTEGMLFIFPNNGYHGIWMKEMNFPIDIVWVDSSFKVVSIEENVKPETYPKVFEPTSPARFVIEANAFFMNSFDVRVGATVEIPNALLPEELQKH